MSERIKIIGYSGHAYIVCDILFQNDHHIEGYYDRVVKDDNPYNLEYLGNEDTIEDGSTLFVGIGDNIVRARVVSSVIKNVKYTRVIHPSAIISSLCNIGEGVLVGANSVVNTMATIGKHVIINSGAIIEHECQIGDFVHIAPGAVLAGNVTVGNKSFIGANAVVKQGVTIGDNVTVGAGSVIIKDIEDNAVVVGNPGRKLNSKG